MKREMSDAPLHIVFSLFDANQDGNLASAELLTVNTLHPSCNQLKLQCGYTANLGAVGFLFYLVLSGDFGIALSVCL